MYNKDDNLRTVKNYYDMVVEKIRVSDDDGYYCDIIHDVNYLLQEKPKICFIFGKNYVSTSVIQIFDNNLIDYKDNERNKAYVSSIDYYIGNLNYYDFCIMIFYGKLHEYDLKREFAKTDVKTTLGFYKNIYINLMKVYFDETTIKQD